MKIRMALFFTLYLFFSVGGLFLFKAHSASLSIFLNKEQFAFRIAPLAVLGSLFYIVSFLLWLYFIKNNDISYISSIMTGSVTACTILGGRFLFREKITCLQVTGMLLIIAGIVLVNINKAGSGY